MHPGLKSKHNAAAAIVADMTRVEKARFCSGKNFWHLEALERHNLQPVMVTDGPHGLRKQTRAGDHVGLNASVPATCFPTASALAASWDVELVQHVGATIADECLAEGVTVLLGPGLNTKRHPYCGRNFEYFSEDPLLTGKLTAAFVNGVQSRGVGTSIKHYAVNNQEYGRMVVDAVVDDITLREIYLRGFQIAVTEAQPWTVMCAYNKVNGEYCSEHDFLLNQVLRDEWGFQGLVVTDWGATNDRVLGLQHGLDLEMPGSAGINDALVEAALEADRLDEAVLDQAITRNVSLSLLGQDVHDNRIEVDLSRHDALARKTAGECVVLLKNEGQTLPASSEDKIAVIGEFAKQPRYQGAGSSQVVPTELHDAWTHLSSACPNLTYARGYDASGDENACGDKKGRGDEEQALIEEAVTVAKQADRVFLFAGLPSIYESEAFDRNHLNLPPQHDRLIEAVSEVNDRVTVILFNGAPVVMPWIDKVSAVVEGYLAGQAGGGAITDVLLGATNPSGKLAETFPLQPQDVPSDQWFPGSLRQVQYREGLFVGYRYFTSAHVPVLFPFGHGLSYTQFEYRSMTVAADLSEVKVTVANIGPRDGAEVVQIYLSPPSTSVRPSMELRGFAKAKIPAGEEVEITIPLDQFSGHEFDPETQKFQPLAGEYTIHAAASSADIRLSETVEMAGQASRMVAPTSLSPFDMNDVDFARMCGRSIPAALKARPYHKNTAVGELTASFLGRKFRERVINNFTESMGGNANDPTLKKMFQEMADNMPLRSMALFSQGNMSFDRLEMIIALLNHRYIRALRLYLANK